MSNKFLNSYSIFQLLLKYRNYLFFAFLLIRATEFLLDIAVGDGDGSIQSFYPYMLLTATKFSLVMGFIALSIVKLSEVDFQNRTQQIFEKLKKASSAYPFFLTAIVYVSFSVYYQQGGFLDNEVEYGASENSTIGFLRHYLSDMPFLRKIFDVRVTDNTAFQSRELSFVFDYIDAQFIDWCIALGIPHFYSLSHYIFTLLIGWWLYSFCINQLNFNAFISLLFVIILWTAPCIFFSATFYRSAKISTSFFLVWYFILLYKVLAGSDKLNKLHADLKSLIPKIYLGITLLGLAVVFTDRQGFFFMLIVLLFLAFKWLSVPSKNTAMLFFSCLFAVAFNTFYNYYLGGKIIFALHGYYPDFTYQKIPWSMLTDWWHYQDAVFFGEAIDILLQEWRLLLGNVPTFVLFTFGVWLIFTFAKYVPWTFENPLANQEISVKGIVGALVFLFLIFIIVLNMLMRMRHPAIYQEGYFRYYYPIPVTVILFILTLLFVQIIQNHSLVKSSKLAILVLLIAMSNIFSLPSHYAVLRSDTAPRAMRINNTPVFLEALRNLDNPNYTTSDSLVSKPIFQFLKNRHTDSRK